MNRQLISIKAPPSPKCFEARDIWLSFLQSLMEIKTASTKPFRDDQYQPAFNFCAQCTPEHRRQMVHERRCFPPITVATPVRLREGEEA